MGSEERESGTCVLLSCGAFPLVLELGSQSGCSSPLGLRTMKGKTVPLFLVSGVVDRASDSSNYPGGIWPVPSGLSDVPWGLIEPSKSTYSAALYMCSLSSCSRF